MSENRPHPAFERQNLATGLYFVATPIGAARDITLRALDILASADVLAAEDTRTLRHLMEIHGITLDARPLIAYHDHNGQQARPRILAALSEGRSVAYASEAGTPLVADPGFQLARAVIADGHPVLTAPGPSAAIAALTVSGLPSNRFMFAGFPPPSGEARQGFLKKLAHTDATVILYESPKRVHRLLEDLAEHLEPERAMVICRELTKRFEEVIRGSLADLRERLEGQDIRGEIVVLLDRAPQRSATPDDLDAALRTALGSHRVKEAAAMIADMFGVPRRDVYQRALRMMEEK